MRDIALPSRATLRLEGALSLRDVALPSRPTLCLEDALSLRGGSAAELDPSRLKVRLEAYGTYAVVSALLMNAALRMFASVPPLEDFRDMPSWARRSLRALYVIASAISILGGVRSRGHKR